MTYGNGRRTPVPWQYFGRHGQAELKRESNIVKKNVKNLTFPKQRMVRRCAQMCAVAQSTKRLKEHGEKNWNFLRAHVKLLHVHVKLLREHVMLLRAHVKLLRAHMKSITCARKIITWARIVIMCASREHVKLLRAHVKGITFAREVITCARKKFSIFSHHVPLGAP